MSIEIRRTENRQQQFSLRVDSFLREYALLGREPQDVEWERSHLFELAHLNAKLVGRGYLPFDPDNWVTILDRFPNRHLPRKMEFEILKEEGHLIR